MWFHCYPDPPERKELGNRAFKEKMVREGRAHAALVLDGDEAVAWADTARCRSCRTSTTARSGRRPSTWCRTTASPASSSTAATGAGVWRRSPCEGPLELIAAQGGGRVEAYPHDLPPERKISSSFLYNATRTMDERLGFPYERPKGKGNCVMSLEVPARR